MARLLDSNVPFCPKCGAPTEVVARREKRYNARTGERADYDRHWVRCRRLRGVGMVRNVFDSLVLDNGGHINDEVF